LPVALGRGTRIIRALLQAGKEYVCVMRLHGDVSEDRLREAIEEFIGEIYQRPPLRSSVKRAVRVKHIYYIQLLEIDGRNVLMRVGCEAGTYMRKLCHDIGEVLGVGAHMRELRRTRVGPFKEDESLATLHILPMERGVEHLPKVVIRDSAVDAICNGAVLAVPGILRLETKIKRGDLVAIMTQKGELIALGKALLSSEEMYRRDRGLAVKPIRVIMKRGTYPPLWKRRRDKGYKFLRR